jgi:hypothetical protein
MRYGFKLARNGGILALLALLANAHAHAAPADKVNVSDLQDTVVGQLGFLSDLRLTQDICVYSSTGQYSVIATSLNGTSAFNLSSGSAQIAYEVQWAASPGQTSGVGLSPNVASPPFTSAATNQKCNSGPVSSATLIVVIRSSVSENARAGTYSDTLSILLSPN